MAVTALLVNQRANRLRYLLVQDGAAGTTLDITTTGAVSPDLRTDSVAGPIRKLSRAQTDGYGAFAAGALVQAQARALFLSDRTSSPGSIETIATGRCEITPRTGTTVLAWNIDANVDGGGNPILSISAAADASTAYLDVEMECGMIGA